MTDRLVVRRINSARRHVGRGLPLTLVALLGSAGFALQMIDARDVAPLDPLLVVAALGATLVAWLITSREPQNGVARLLEIFAFATTGAFFASRYAIAAFDRVLPLPAPDVAAWIGSKGGGRLEGWLWLVAITAPLFVGFIVPTGRPASARWTRVFRGSVAVIGVSVLVAALGSPDSALTKDSETITNPFYVASFRPAFEFLSTPPFVITSLLLLLSTTALLARFRGSRGVERQQLKWIVVGLLIMLVAASVGGVVNTAPIAPAFYATTVLALPIVLGIAILQYRLYDIDALIRRTAVYTTTSVTIALAFVASVVLMQGLLEPVTGGPEIAVAIATLASLALFRPLLTAVQRAVDRRFYRARYDAQQTLDSFNARVRDAVDLDAVRRDLLASIDETVQPATASLWLRESAR